MKKYLSAKQLCVRYDVKAASTIWRWAAAGIIPKPKKITPACTRWDVAELEAWDSERENSAA